MHFLLTNDDGIDAPGLAALEDAVRSLPGASCTVVAPAAEQSQCGHRVTTHELLTLAKLGNERYTTSGTPADCVRVALFVLGIKPDFVVSGVNAGGNMGQDLYISGTVAAAREAAFHGLPAAAFSHYVIRDLTMEWRRTADWTRQVLEQLLKADCGDGEHWNINFPHLPSGPIAMPERISCHPCRAPLNVSYASSGGMHDARQDLSYTASYASRPVESDSDVAVCFGGKIAVSKLRIG